MWDYGPGWSMMGHWGIGHWVGPHGMIFWLLLIALVVLAVVWIVRRADSGRSTPPERRSAGLDVLEERYARGEINRDEYLQKKRDITG